MTVNVAEFKGAVNWGKATSVATTSSVNIWDVDGMLIHLTGTTQVDNFGTSALPVGACRKVVADGAFTMKETANLSLPGAADINVKAGDSFWVFVDTATKCLVLDFIRWSGPGRVEDLVYTQDGALQEFNATIPHDGTIPQNNEGNEVMTRAITPKNAQNLLVIDVYAFGNEKTNFAASFVAALFRDSTAGALAAGATMGPSGSVSGGAEQVSFRHILTAGSVAATTFKVRLGANASGTFSFNGQAGVLYGGKMASSISIMEIAL